MDLHLMSPGGVVPPSPIRSAFDLPRLKANRNYSIDRLQKLESVLRGVLGSDQVTVAVSGSLGRLEASDQSDVDCIVVSEAGGALIREKVDAAIVAVGLERPNPEGVFAGAMSFRDLASQIGEQSEGYERFSRRLLLLLESRPVYNPDLYGRLIGAILEQYMPRDGRRLRYVFLLNDLVRYFRTVCVNNQATSIREPHKRAIRNAKLRHSRIVMYCGLLFALARASGMRDADSRGWLGEQLNLTPLERISSAYTYCDDPGIAIVAACYERFLEYLSDPDSRVAMGKLRYDERHENDDFQALRENSDIMVSELIRFLTVHRARWDRDFLRFMLF